MPLIDISNDYKQNWYSNNKHLATIIPSMTRKIVGVHYKRERLILNDDDFVDLDWLKNGNDKLLIITHGLEGNSEKHYVKGLALEFAQDGWDILSWNCRSCSGEMNLGPKLYHHGDIDDIQEVYQHAIKKSDYKQVAFAGYSMGGVINTKFIAKIGGTKTDLIKLNIAISTPCDLKACALTLDVKRNFIYKNKFFKSLSEKLIAKEKQHQGIIDVRLLKEKMSWAEFDEKISAPFNGYQSSQELYSKATINNWLAEIQIPTLILNSTDDPLVPRNSNPIEFAKKSEIITLALTSKGGHCGFEQIKSNKSFAEVFSLQFANKIIK